MGSRIVFDFPSVLYEFSLKKWELLWQVTRDGFRSSDFHSRCDGHANTVTLILTTSEDDVVEEWDDYDDIGCFVFGGFTPVKWESRRPMGDGSNCWKSDNSFGSFLFTL
jgi:hypothetical protein